MLVFPLMAVWLLIPPALGYLIGRWWALALSLLPAWLAWGAIFVWGYGPQASSIDGDPFLVAWFGFLMLFLFLTLPPLGLTAVAIAWRRWA